ncbi:unnamed protein product [Ambrosiozyma monospora]|uniref:Unnamed protein product n=1 Tax=Ambrosiozyma monospora TaxID=43982 RepID=A0A9W6YQQ4_AMBMO|nr:unnamed protein product [Ambrosiozyma monospora]
MESRTNECLPFKDLKCSSTSISSLMKKDLANKIEIMGGTFVSDLLADTEVLIVGDVTTDKYKFCARKRADIKLIGPETISNVYRLFVNNSREFDKSILDGYPMPTFENFNICMSRLPAHKEKIYEKEYLVALVREFGGSVSEALTKDSTIVVAVERKGKRYTKAIEWGVPVVHPKWILDSAVRGAVLDTKYYEIDKVPSADIGEDSCLVWDQLKDPVDYYQFNEDIYNKYYGKQKPIVNKHLEVVPDDDAALEKDSIFVSCCFYTYGFTDRQTEKLHSVIRQKGGEIFEEDYNSITHLLIPSNIAFRTIPNDLRKLIDNYDLKVVNEWFVERSLFYEKIMMDSWSIPRKYCTMSFNLKII